MGVPGRRGGRRVGIGGGKVAEGKQGGVVGCRFRECVGEGSRQSLQDATAGRDFHLDWFPSESEVPEAVQMVAS